VYFNRGQRNAVYAVSLAVSLALFLVLFLQGIYSPEKPYFIPITQRVNNALVLGIIVAMLFPSVIEYNNSRWTRGIDVNTPRLLMDITEAVRSGVPLIKSLEEASTRDYGPITKPLEQAMVRVNVTSDLEGSLGWLSEKLVRPVVKRMNTILIEAYETGGKIIDVLEMSVELFTNLAEYSEERYAQMRPYIIIVYLSSFIFLFISWVILIQFLGPLNAVSSEPFVVNAGILRNLLDISYYKSILFWAAVMESVFGGLVAGKIGEGRMSAGLIHSVILLLITVIFYNMIRV